MLLATQCPNCRTTFKVAHDQLKLQAGLVRCGVCHEVFNGVEHLASPPAATPTNPGAALIIDPVTPELQLPASETVVQAKAVVEVEPSPADDTSLDMFDSFGVDMEAAGLNEPYLEPTIAMQVKRPETSSLNEEFSPNQSEAGLAAKVQTLLDADLQTVEDAPMQAAPMQAAPMQAAPMQAAPIAPEHMDATLPHPGYIDALMLDDHDVSIILAQEASAALVTDAGQPELSDLGFIRQAQVRRRMRWIIATATVVLLVTLIGQGLVQFRDFLAASYPQTRASLTALCTLAHCQIRLPAQLDAISYEADELHTLARPGMFEFSLLMHNHSAVPQAWPAIELTMKDSHKQPVIRRVFSPAEYLANPRDVANGFAGGQEQQVKLYFVIDQAPVTDYLVALFYP